MSTTSVAAAFKDAFYTWAVTNWSGDPVQVQFGIPGPNQQDDIVGFLDVTAEQGRPPSAPNVLVKRC